jgi:hypothetical protein
MPGTVFDTFWRGTMHAGVPHRLVAGTTAMGIMGGSSDSIHKRQKAIAATFVCRQAQLT